jgi:hypothetical protein
MNNLYNDLPTPVSTVLLSGKPFPTPPHPCREEQHLLFLNTPSMLKEELLICHTSLFCLKSEDKSWDPGIISYVFINRVFGSIQNAGTSTRQHKTYKTKV